MAGFPSIRPALRILLSTGLLAWCLTGCTAPESVVVTVPLEIVASRGVWTDADSARLLSAMPAPDDNGRIWIEAERAQDLVVWPTDRVRGQTAHADPEASGGRFVRGVSTARYYLHAEAAAAMDIYLRVKGSPFAKPVDKQSAPVHRVLLNGKPLTADPLPYGPENVPAGWTWIKVSTGLVNKGENLLEVVRSSRALMQTDAPAQALDVVLLVPKGQRPAEPEPGLFKLRPVGEGMVETADVTVPGLVSWESVGYRAGSVGPGADIPELWCSVDGGQTWRRKAPSEMAARPGRPIRFRIGLSKVGGGDAPWFRGLRLRARVDPSRFIELKNADSRLVFDGDTGGLFLAENTTTDQTVCAPGRPWPIGAIAFKKPGETVWHRVDPEGDALQQGPRDTGRGMTWPLENGVFTPRPTTPSRVAAQGNRLEMTFRFERQGLGMAEVDYVVQPTGDGAWRIVQSVRSLEGPADVVHQVCPILPRVRIGSSGLDDYQRRPSGGWSQTMRPGRDPLPTFKYRGDVVQSWTDISDDRSGIYVGLHDASTTDLLFRSVGSGDAGDSVYMEFERRESLKPGESATVQAVLDIHPGSWHRGADRYRRWFHRVHGKATYPEHLRKMDGWCRKAPAEPLPGFVGIDDLPDGLATAGTTIVFWGDTRRLVRYTLPDRLMFDEIRTDDETSARSMSWAWLEGSRFVLHGEPSPLQKAFLELRRRVAPWFYEAEPLDDRGLVVSHGGVHVRLFRATGAPLTGGVVNLLNRYGLADAKVAVSTERIGPIDKAFVLTLDGRVKPLALRHSTDAVGFDVPEDIAATVLLVGPGGTYRPDGPAGK